MVLQYCDDILTACTNPSILATFRTALSARFDLEWNARAHWYLQARLAQDADSNITLDQSRYARSIVARYIPNAPVPASPADLETYRDPLPLDFRWSSTDCSTSPDALLTLERQFGFRLIEVAGSLNYLTHTAVGPLFAIRKLCRFTRSPGLAHFEAALHLLHHLRCYPPPALKFYHTLAHAPLTSMLRTADLSSVDCSLVWFTDSSFADCDDQRSTGCHIGMAQGGVINASSFVPQPVALSSAEAEVNALTVGITAAMHAKYLWMELLTGNSESPLTLPVFVDNSAAIAISSSERASAKTRHIARRHLFCREMHLSGAVNILHLSRDLQPSDVGTKNLSHAESAFKLSLLTAPLPS